MAIQTLKFGGKKFVVVEEREYKALTRQAKAAADGQSSKLSSQDQGDIAEARRRSREKGFVSLEDVKKRLGMK